MNKREPRKSWMAEIKLPHDGKEPPARKSSLKSLARTAAAQEHKSPAAPSGVGLTSKRLRERMVERLRESGIRNERVLAAMELIERHRFVDEALASRAYEDSSLPIGHEQTISQPYIVARMTELVLAGARPDAPVAKVLEIGTGCGYQAAILSRVVDEVYSIERIRALHEKARINLRSFRFPNLRLVYGDGLLGLPEAAPFDAMLIAAAGDNLPRALLEQLRIGGRALAPLSTQEKGSQSLCLIVRTGVETWTRTELEPVRFVPLLKGQI